jgi:hypothetical protein
LTEPIFTGSTQLKINATSEAIFSLITDVTRMGEWSPETYRCSWLKGASGPAVGAQFRGYNRHKWFWWFTSVRVTDLEPDRVFAFEAMPIPFLKAVQTRWRYDLEPVEGGTLVTESFQVRWTIPGFARVVFGTQERRRAELEAGAGRTLERIKAVAEG